MQPEKPRGVGVAGRPELTCIRYQDAAMSSESTSTGDKRKTNPIWRETSLLIKLAKVGRVRNDAAAMRANERVISPSSLFITEQHWLTDPC